VLVLVLGLQEGVVLPLREIGSCLLFGLLLPGVDWWDFEGCERAVGGRRLGAGTIRELLKLPVWLPSSWTLLDKYPGPPCYMVWIFTLVGIFFVRRWAWVSVVPARRA
jgi:hypothetical protein